EPQRPNMSWRVFTCAVLLLLFVMMCCCTGGAVHAGESKSGDVQLPQWVDVFVPNKTQVVPKEGSETGVKDSFAAPSLVRAGGVMIAFAEGLSEYDGHEHDLIGIRSSDIVAGYIKAAETWPSIVAEVNDVKWRAHTVLGSGNDDNHLSVLHWPTSIARDNKVFLLAGSDTLRYDTGSQQWVKAGWDIQLVEGVATQSTDGEQSTLINWAEPKSLSQQISTHTQGKLTDFLATGGSGIVMQNGTLVFPLVAEEKNGPTVSMITYSTDDGKNWVFSMGMASGGCADPRITEWEKGQILMIVQCFDGQSVYESRDMGATWTEAVGTLSGVWVRPELGVHFDEKLRVGA
ncbi:trans-sialidase, putative, partial [Trypanosoma cruzi marinkellei]